MSRVRTAAAALAASGVVLAGCGGEAPDSTGGGSVPLPEATPAVPDDAPGVPGRPSAGPDGALSGPDGAPALPEVSDPGDGTHAASIAAVGEAARTVTVDLVDVGEDATEPLTLPVADDVQVTVLWLGGGGAEAEQIGFEELAGYLERSPAGEAPAPFWITIEDGVVTVIEEQDGS